MYTDSFQHFRRITIVGCCNSVIFINTTLKNIRVLKYLLWFFAINVRKAFA